MTKKQEFREWCRKRSNCKGKWLKFTTEQKWFIFINQRTQVGPLVKPVSNGVPSGMVWNSKYVGAYMIMP
jgi:hypothetical protein